MVVNEITKSVQKSTTTKVVTAGTVALLASGSALAVENIQVNGEEVVFTEDQTVFTENIGLNNQSYSAIRIKGTSNVNFNGDKLFATNHTMADSEGQNNYTAFNTKIDAGNGTIVKFNGGNVTLNAIGGYGAQGVTFISNATPATLTFNNTGNVSINAVVEGSGVAQSNAIGILGNYQVIEVTDAVQNFDVNVYGSGKFTGDALGSNGTEGIFIAGDTATFNSKNLNVNVIAGQDQTVNLATSADKVETYQIAFDQEAAKNLGTSYAITYGINSKGKTLVGAGTDSKIVVHDAYWNAIGLSNDPLYIDYEKAASKDWSSYQLGGESTSLKMLGNVSVDVEGASIGYEYVNGSDIYINAPSYKRVNGTYGLYANVTKIADASDTYYDSLRSIVELGSAGKTVDITVANNTENVAEDIYGVYAGKADVTVAGASASIKVNSKTSGTAYGIQAVNSSVVNLQADLSEIAANGATDVFAISTDESSIVTVGKANISATGKHTVGAYIGETATLNLNGDTTITAGNAFEGSGVLNVAGILEVGSSSLKEFAGSVNLNKGSNLTVDTANWFDKATVTLNGGNLTSSSGAFFTIALNEAGDNIDAGALTSLIKGITVENGTLTVTDSFYNLQYAMSAGSLFDKGQVVFTGEKVLSSTETNTDKGSITVDEVANEGTGNTVLGNTELDHSAVEDNKYNLVVGGIDSSVSEGSTAVVNGNLGVANIKLTDQATSVTINSGKTLTLDGGSTEELISGGAEDMQIHVGSVNDSTAGALQLGVLSDAVKNAGTISKEVVVNTQGTVSVVAGDFTLANVTNRGQMDVEQGANLNIGSIILEAESKLAIAGSALIDTIKDAAADALISVGNEMNAGALKVTGSLGGATVFLDPEFDAEKGVDGASRLMLTNAEVDGNVIAGQNSFILVGSEDATPFTTAMTESGMTWGADGVTAALFAANPFSVTSGSITIDGALTSAPASSLANGEVVFGANSLFVADMATANLNSAYITATSVMTDATAKALLMNVRADTLYQLVENGTAWINENVVAANAMFVLDEENSVDGSYQFTVQEASQAYQGLMQGTELADASMRATGSEYDYANALLSDANGDKVAAAARFDTAMNPAGAVATYTTAYDRATDMRAKVREEAGVIQDSHLWVTLSGGKTKYDDLETGAQSINVKTESFGVVVGGETRVADTAVGVAFATGTGSTRNCSQSAKDDFNYYGLSGYANRAFGDYKVTADVGATLLKSDINVGGVADVNTDVDTVVYSFGIEGKRDFAIAGITVSPFVALDVYHLRVDDVKTNHGAKTESANATVVEMPIGVQASANYETADGTKVAPALTLAAVPAFGDTDIDVDTTFAGATSGYNFTFADDFKMRTNLSVSAERKNFRLGVGVGYDWGNKERSAVTGQVTARFFF